MMEVIPFKCKHVFAKIMMISLNCVELCRDCMTFAFMDLIQSELDNVVQMWNTHLIRRTLTLTLMSCITYRKLR